MYYKAPTYSPSSGQPPVAGKDYQILSRGQVKRRSERHFFSTAVSAAGLLGAMFLSTVVAKVAIENKELQRDPDVYGVGIALLAAGYYCGQKTHRSWRLSQVWDNVHTAMQARGHTHTVWMNPHICKGDTPRTPREETETNALRALPQIPEYNPLTHGVTIGGAGRDLRL